MSDADRLRAAAEITEITSYLNPHLEPTPGALEKEAHERNAVAALLRAVADDVKIGLYIVGAESPAAALALASVILGGTDD